MSSDLSTGKTIFILAVVVGCFAVLWPKVFYPMLTASVKQSGSSQVVNWRDPGNARVLSQLCFLIEEQQDPSGFSRLTDDVCIEFVRKSCGVTVNEKVAEDFRLSKDKTNLTFCLHQRFDITLENVLSTAPPPTRTKPYQSQSLPHPHVRPERPSHLHPEVMHPALRDKGRTIPHRTIEKQARPGPMPGVRPPMGGGGHMVPPQTKGSGAMGIIMPLYTVGIVIFFVYTIMKVLFKKSDDEESKIPKLKDFHLDPEYRKYVFAEEYLDSSNASHRDLLKRQERENSKQRRRQDSASQPDTKIEDEQMDQLRRRLEETEKAMERLMSQMGSVTDKLTAAKITEVLSQAQSQARILKMGLDNVVSSDGAEGNEASVPPAPSTSLTTTTLTSTPSKVTFVPSPPQIFYTMDAAEGGSDEDLTTSEAFTNTLSEDFSLPLALQRHLEELKVKDMYLKGTSAGNFGSPPISPDELESPNGRHNSIQGSAPLIATNTTLLSSFTNGNDAIPIDKSSQLDGIVSEKNIQNEHIKECKLDQEDANQIPVVDFPLQVSSSLKQNLKNDKKQKEDLVLSSDIAQYDAAGGHSDREGSSDASETGADISELKSFADNGAVEVTGSIPIPVVEEQAIPEVTYSPRFTETIETDDENVIRKPVILSSDGKQYTSQIKSPAVEHGTQTEENQKLSVLNLRTTYLIDKKEQNKGLNIKEVEDRVNEIVLDATLPVDTQLLVKEAQTGSAVTNNIEIDASEIGSEPCVVTSQVSLAFIGLEHNDIEGPYTLVVPEARSKDPPQNQNVKIFQQPLSEKEVKSTGFVERRNHSENQEHPQKGEVKPEEIESGKDSEHAFLSQESDSKGPFLYKSNAVQHPKESSELNQESLIGNETCDVTNLSLLKKEILDNSLGYKNDKNRDALQCSSKNEEAGKEFITSSQCGDKTPEQVHDLPKDPPNVKKDDLPFQSSENKELSDDDFVHVEDDSSDKTDQQLQDLPKDPSNFENDDEPFQSAKNKELIHVDPVHAEDSSSDNIQQQLLDLPKNPSNVKKDDLPFQSSENKELSDDDLVHVENDSSDKIDQQLQELPKDPSNFENDDEPFQSTKNKELIHEDPVHAEDSSSDNIQQQLPDLPKDPSNVKNDDVPVQSTEIKELTYKDPVHVEDDSSDKADQQLQDLPKDPPNFENDDVPFQSKQNKELILEDPVHVGDSSSDNIQQQLLDLPKDPSNVKKDDVPFQSTENKELTHGDAVHVEDDSSEKADQQLQDLPKDPPNFENDDELFQSTQNKELIHKDPVHVEDSSSDKIQQQLQNLPKDPSNVKKDDVPFQSTQNKELAHGDPVHVEDDSSEKADKQLQDLPKDPPNVKNDDIPFQSTQNKGLKQGETIHVEDNRTDKTQQKLQALPEDPPNVNNEDVSFQCTQNNELEHRDPVHIEDTITFYHSTLINEIKPQVSKEENIVISQHLTDKDEKNCSGQLHTFDNILSQKLSEDLECRDNEGASIINSDILPTNELVSDITLDDVRKFDDRLCEGMIEFPKTISVESFDLTPEILHGLEEPTTEEEFIAIEFVRPQSPIPPSNDNSKTEDRDTHSVYDENEHLILEVYNDESKASVRELASTLVEETTKNALQHISSLTPEEISKRKNEALNLLESSIGTTHEIISAVGENTGKNNFSLESNLNFQSKTNLQEQPGEVVSCGESGGENENIFVTTIHNVSKDSPPGSPFQSDINTSFSLENVNLTDHCTQSVTPTPLFEDPALKSEDGCSKELRSPSPDSSILIAETIREQESAFKQSSLDSHETDMNHKG
ncbi:UNVERIFIED_CONTAM: hypothetical protein RMT77_009491 [Armadillidium vulgare]